MNSSNNNDDFEWLTIEICREYKRRADMLPHNDGKDIGERRKLRIELQERCHIQPIEAINILNGYYCDLYVHRYDMLSGKIPLPEGFVKKGQILEREKNKRPHKDLIDELEEKIALLEDRASKRDDYGFEEKD